MELIPLITNNSLVIGFCFSNAKTLYCLEQKAHMIYLNGYDIPRSRLIKTMRLDSLDKDHISTIKMLMSRDKKSIFVHGQSWMFRIRIDGANFYPANNMHTIHEITKIIETPKQSIHMLKGDHGYTTVFHYDRPRTWDYSNDGFGGSIAINTSGSRILHIDQWRKSQLQHDTSLHHCLYVNKNHDPTARPRNIVYASATDSFFAVATNESLRLEERVCAKKIETEEFKHINVHTHYIKVAPDGLTLLLRNDNYYKLLNAHSKNIIQVITEFDATDKTLVVEFSSDGKYLYSGGGDEAKLYVGGNDIKRLELKDGIRAAPFFDLAVKAKLPRQVKFWPLKLDINGYMFSFDNNKTRGKIIAVNGDSDIELVDLKIITPFIKITFENKQDAETFFVNLRCVRNKLKYHNTSCGSVNEIIIWRRFDTYQINNHVNHEAKMRFPKHIMQFIANYINE